MDKDLEKRKRTPAELLLQQLELPLDTVSKGAELNNGAMKLFVEGQLTNDQLAKFSLDLARRADELADKILHTDMRKNTMPETKQMGYSAMQTLAQENRNRAMILTLERQRRQPPQTPQDVVMGKK